MAKADLPVHTNQMPRMGTHAGARVREDAAYTDHKGEEKDKVAKRTRMALEKLQEPLSKLLQPDEAVLFVAEAMAPVGQLEQLTMGWYIYRASRAVLVFTNRRILHFSVKPKRLMNWEWKKALRSIQWGDIAEAKVKGFLRHTLELKYRNGQKEKYWAIKGGDAKKMKLLVEALLPQSTTETTPAMGAVSLCPKCMAALTPRVYECAQCRQAFKDEKTMVRRSWLIPGGGYFYTGHWILGVPDFMAEGIILLALIFFVLVGLGVVADVPDPGEEPLTGAEAFITAGIFALILLVEKAITIHHCRRFIRDYIPIEP